MPNRHILSGYHQRIVSIADCYEGHTRYSLYRGCMTCMCPRRQPVKACRKGRSGIDLFLSCVRPAYKSACCHCRTSTVCTRTAEGTSLLCSLYHHNGIRSQILPSCRYFDILGKGKMSPTLLFVLIMRHKNLSILRQKTLQLFDFII